EEVQVDAEGQGGVASCEPARRDEHVVERGDAESAELLGDRSREVAAPLDLGEALERKARLAVVPGGATTDLLCEPLGESNQALAWAGLCCQLKTHLRFLSVGAGARKER